MVMALFTETNVLAINLSSVVISYVRLILPIRSRSVQVKEEHRCVTSGYSIDALVTLNDGKQVAVEVDGPSHFLGHSQQPNGATLLKHRQLRKLGWRLESVPYWEWDRCKELHWLPKKPVEV